ncbi:MAG: hypothetical protein AAF613_05445 [Pseudomonadota bacterium]
MTGLLSLVVASLLAVGVGIGLTRLMADRPRWMGLAAFAIMLVGIVAGVILGFPNSDLGRAFFVFGLVTAPTAWTIHAPRLTSVILWSLLASMLLSAALMLTLPVPFRALAIWMALAVSLIWVGFQFWCYWDKRGWRVASGLVLVSLTSGYIVFTTPPPA